MPTSHYLMAKIYAGYPQWAGFIRKSGVGDAISLRDTVKEIAEFAAKPLTAAQTDTPLLAKWRKGGPWK